MNLINTNRKIGYFRGFVFFLMALSVPYYCEANEFPNYDDSVVNVSTSNLCCDGENIDSIIVLYWNVEYPHYETYCISYSIVSEKMAVFLEWCKDYPVYYVDSIEQKHLFLSSIYDFYVKKTNPIVERKTKHDTDEHTEYDIPTFSITCYNKGKIVFTSNTQLEHGDYELTFNLGFEKFRNMVFSIVDEYDKYVDNIRNGNGLYRCRYY